jgi:hypothetical protein
LSGGKKLKNNFIMMENGTFRLQSPICLQSLDKKYSRENITAQQLVLSLGMSLFYWKSEGRMAEVDF